MLGETNPALPHRRFNPLTGEWVLVSPHRSNRPWQGQTEPAAPQVPAYDPKCYLCPGNSRVSGAQNPRYENTFAFPNDFPSLLEATLDEPISQGMLRAEPVSGTCEVLCYSPDHSQTLATMSEPAIGQVIDLWCKTSLRLGGDHAWVQIFENRGSAMGMSSPHPHGQVWATSAVPTLVDREDQFQSSYYETYGRPLLIDYVNQEVEAGARIVISNDCWIWVVPFWATWPFEILLLPRHQVSRLEDMTDHQKSELGEILKAGLSRYDRLFSTPFPYSMGWHFAPYSLECKDHWTLHAHFYPPLLRSASVRKFMVGFEMLAEAQRDITPEEAAQRLRNV